MAKPTISAMDGAAEPQMGLRRVGMLHLASFLHSLRSCYEFFR